jgi:hypothetical protein
VTASITCGRELGLVERANTREPLINVVTVDKPKVLTGLDQKVRGRCRGFCTLLPQTDGHRRTGGAHPTVVLVRNVVSPLLSLTGR